MTKTEFVLNEKINKNKDELKDLGSIRLWKGITIGSAISAFLFGYLWSDLHQIDRDINKELIKMEERCHEKHIQ